jgi:hypothetical protein
MRDLLDTLVLDDEILSLESEDRLVLLVKHKCGNGNKIGVSRNLLRCSRQN